MRKLTPEQSERFADQLRKKAEEIAAECIRNDPENAELYRDRLRRYEPIKYKMVMEKRKT